MQYKYQAQPFYVLLIIFVLVCSILLLLMTQLKLPQVNYNVLLVGNGILFIATLISLYLHKKAISNNNVQAFLRYFYGGMVVRMFICIVAAMTYILIARSGVSKAAIFGCFILYFLYTFVEVRIVMRLSKQQKDA